MMYTSTERKNLSFSHLKKILLGARLRNKSKSVTGMLIHSSGAFLQILEGRESDVHLIFARIVKDSRHGDIRILHQGFSDRRKFGEWSMGYADADSSAKLLKGFKKLRNHLDLKTLNRARAENIFSACSQGLLEQFG